ncbi:MAG: M48 family metalloprotease [Parachlamydia sp.]|nr:M48 family metalloprotease [Parachlamydia sp.]
MKCATAKEAYCTLLSLLILTACSVNPVTGRSEMALVSAEQEIELGSEHFVKMQEAQGGLYSADPAISTYVSKVGHKLAAVSDRPDLPFEFVVLNNDTPNAWTLPGGKIAVNRGLLTELHSEAELAAVLSHEIVHAAARHGAQSLERQMVAMGGIIGAQEVLRDSKHQELLVGSTLIGAELILLRYSRQAELEADHYGILYMARAGYDPQAAVALQETFLRLAENEDPHWLEGLFLTHPPTKERLEANHAIAAKLPQGGFVGKEEYETAIKPLRQ